MIYNIFIGLGIAIIVSMIIMFIICLMIVASENDNEFYRPKNNKKK